MLRVIDCISLSSVIGVNQRRRGKFRYAGPGGPNGKNAARDRLK
jgi:hypothetical protein